MVARIYCACDPEEMLSALLLPFYTDSKCFAPFCYLFYIDTDYYYKGILESSRLISATLFLFTVDQQEPNLNVLETRMHSSRMRTGRSLTVCCSLLPGGGVVCLVRGGVLPAGGVCLVQGGVLPAGEVCLVRGGVCLVLGGEGCSPEAPPVNRITDTCKNITLATTSLRPVTINYAKGLIHTKLQCESVGDAKTVVQNPFLAMSDNAIALDSVLMKS